VQALVPDRLQLRGGGVRVLHRRHPEPDQPGGVGSAQRRAELVDVPRQRQPVGGGQVVPQQRGHRREHLGVDARGVLFRDAPLGVEEHVAGPEPGGAEQQRPCAVAVDGLHPRETLRRVRRVVVGQQVGVGVDEHSKSSSRMPHLGALLLLWRGQEQQYGSKVRSQWWGWTETWTACCPFTSPASVSIARAVSSRPNVWVCNFSRGNRRLSMIAIASA
jgi:hypothetical protein